MVEGLESPLPPGDPPVLGPTGPRRWDRTLRATAAPVPAGSSGSTVALQELRVETMKGIVTTVPCTGEALQSIKVAYLTHNQVLRTNEAMMPRLHEALDIQDPKLIIRIVPCLFGRRYWESAAGYSQELRKTSAYGANMVPQLCDADEEEVEHELNMFAKEVLLPLAQRHQALVIGSSACSLMNAFAKTCAPLQRRYGDQCPFHLLCFEHACNLLKATMDDSDGLERVIQQQVKEWNDVSLDLFKALGQKLGSDTRAWPAHSLMNGCDRCVLYESLIGDQNGVREIDCRAGDRFSDMFVHSLSNSVPVVGIWTHGDGNLCRISEVAEHVNQGLPLILLNTRPWNLTSVPENDDTWQRCQKICDSFKEPELKETCQQLLSLGCALNAQQKTDTYTATALAFLKRAVTKMQRKRLGNPRDDRCLWLCEAIEKAMLEQNDHCSTREEADVLALEEQEISKVAHFFLHYVSIQDYLTARFLIDENERRILCPLKEAQNISQLEVILQTPVISLDGSLLDHTSLGLVVPNGEKNDGAEVAAIQSQLVTAFSAFLKEERQTLAVKHDLRAFAADSQKWQGLYTLLKSNHVHSVSSDDLPELAAHVNRLACADHLPKNNTLQGLVLLRYAWTLIDIFESEALWAKRMAKLSYLLLLLLSAAVVVGTTTPPLQEAISDEVKKYCLVSLGLASSCLAAWTSFTDPAKKWHKLRAASQILRAEIWKYRTRVGNYAASRTRDVLGRAAAEREAASGFRKMIEKIQRNLLDSGLIAAYALSTATLSDEICVDWRAQGDTEVQRLMEKRYKEHHLSKAHFKHKQHYPQSKQSKATNNKATNIHGPEKGEDGHHSPTGPDEYVRWRITPLLQFYRGRCPVYRRIQLLLRAAFISCSVATAALAAADLGSWTAVVVTLSSALGSWHEFTRVGEKLERYVSVIERLSRIMLWWMALAPVDKASPENIEDLVVNTEAALFIEHSAWLNDAEAAKTMVDAAMKGSKPQGTGPSGGGPGPGPGKPQNRKVVPEKWEV